MSYIAVRGVVGWEVHDLDGADVFEGRVVFLNKSCAVRAVRWLLGLAPWPARDSSAA